MPHDHSAEPSPPHQVGPYTISRSAEELVLRLEHRGELGVQGCLLFGFTLLVLLTLGLLAIVQTVTTTPQHPPGGGSIDSPSRFFAPQQNHFGFLWIFISLLMLVLIPWYVSRVYQGAMTFTFRRPDDAFLRDGRLVTQLRRIESLRITESRDPDSRYLYLLHLLYNDGRSLLLHDAYDEREIMNLANEIAAFVGTRVVWS